MRLSEAADNYLRNNTRLGIPAIQIAECLHGQLAFGATIFPQTITQGSTWNPALIEKMGSVIAQEAQSFGELIRRYRRFSICERPQIWKI